LPFSPTGSPIRFTPDQMRTAMSAPGPARVIDRKLIRMEIEEAKGDATVLAEYAIEVRSPLPASRVDQRCDGRHRPRRPHRAIPQLHEPRRATPDQHANVLGDGLVGRALRRGQWLLYLGDNHRDAGAAAEARDAWRRALDISMRSPIPKPNTRGQTPAGLTQSTQIALTVAL